MLAGKSFRAKITCVDPAKLDRSFAGRDFDRSFLASSPRPPSIPAAKTANPHTFVYAAPVFSAPLKVCTGEIVERDGFIFADVLPDSPDPPI